MKTITKYGLSLVLLSIIGILTFDHFTAPTPIVHAQVGVIPDYCQNSGIAKTTVSVAITSATTTNLVSAVSGKTVHVCYAYLNVVGTNPTLQFKAGTTTSSACDTGAVSLTGAIPVATSTNFQPTTAGPPFSLVTGVLSNQLCLTTGGTITTVEGFLVVVQI